MLNRMRVKITRNSKKMHRTDRNKSDSPHLRGNIACWRAFARRWSIKERKIKTSKQNTTRTCVHLYTGRAPAAARGPATGTDAEGFIFLELVRLPPPGSDPWFSVPRYVPKRRIFLSVMSQSSSIWSHCFRTSAPVSLVPDITRSFLWLFFYLNVFYWIFSTGFFPLENFLWDIL